MPDSYLSKKGYVIKKESISIEALKELKKELRAKPLSDDKYNFDKTDNSYSVYIETKSKIYIPKMFGINKFGFPENVLENYEGKQWENDVKFNGTLLEHQIEPVNALLKACEEKGGGILSIFTGSGKSVMGLYVLSKLQGKTIIVVNKIPLMDQWKNEINTFLPGLKVNILQGKKIPDDDCDIVIAMLQSMSRIDYPDIIFNDFKTVLIDEIHNCSSRVFSQIFFKITSKYTIGLSATPKRADGCEYVFKWHIGEIVYESKVERIGKPPIIICLKIDTKEYKEISTINKFTGEKQIQFTSMLTDLIQMPKRNLLTIQIIKSLIKEKRKILVIGHRRDHLQNLKNFLDQDLSITFTYGLFLGAMKQKDLDQSRSCQVILATNKAFGEGVSERELETIILVSPMKFIGHLKNRQENAKKESGKLNQLIGRIFRKNHIDKNPKIIDFCDNFSIYKNQATGRKAFYKEYFKNGIFEDQSINLDLNEDVSIAYIKTKKTKEKIEINKNNILNHCIID